MKVQKPFERLEIRFICKFWSISLLLNPDPHSQNGSGSRRAKSKWIHVDPDPQNCPEDFKTDFLVISCRYLIDITV